MPCRAICRYVAARSGLRSTEPTAGRLPPGRKSWLVELNWAKRAWFCRVSSRIVASTVKPRRATLIAGRRLAARLRRPQRLRAFCQVARFPGTPEDGQARLGRGRAVRGDSAAGPACDGLLGDLLAARDARRERRRHHSH